MINYLQKNPDVAISVLSLIISFFALAFNRKIAKLNSYSLQLFEMKKYIAFLKKLNNDKLI